MDAAPPDDELPSDIKKVKGSLPVCDGGLDCIAAVGGSVNVPSKSKKKKSGKKMKFEMCIDGENVQKKNFYIPDEDEEAYCGTCKL